MTMLPGPTSLASRLLAGLLAVVPLLGAAITSVSTREDNSARLPPRARLFPECPHVWNMAKVDRKPDNPQTDTFAVPGIITNVPEFHDCQRFLQHGASAQRGEYLSLFAVFASFHLDSMFDSLLPNERQRPRRAGEFNAVAAGEVYSDGDRYEWLGIEPRFNCLYVYRQKGQLLARMVPVGNSDAECAKDRDPTHLPNGMDLEVRVTQAHGFHDRKNYAPVARWDWDSTRNEYYIGLGCGSAHCEIGRPGFTSSHSNTSTLQTRAVKGWYDEQRLEIVPQPGQYYASQARGAVYPDEHLGDMNSISAFDSTWVHVASVEILSGLSPSEAASYRQHHNFEERGTAALSVGATALHTTAPTSGMNEIFFCAGTHCRTLEPAAHLPNCTGSNSSANGPWYGRIVSVAGRVQYTCVIRRDHSGMGVTNVPATARFRWVLKDETVWARCLIGCCQVQAL